ncbi:caspase family protein [Aureitalea sp. L0-47]|uniref:caspase family protein n=1 Tax=Aureitalea sp. L0-47 TaxID=2816962 RepID=UPI0022378594|nr:caspase family protein [Aureitalea sp. L0-47]MCW5519391.1 caspase family protein [Aureitalea sp. L0-47]
MSKLNNAYGLIIGVGNDLPASVRDAQAIYNILSNKDLAGYLEENLTLLVEEDATDIKIKNALQELVKKTNEDSSVFIFYSGHGGTYTDNDIIELEQGGEGMKPDDENQSHYYLVPNNFDPKNYRDTWVHASELKQSLREMKSRRLILFLDCCHAEGMTKAGNAINVKDLKQRLKNPEGMVHRIDDGQGISIVSSCRSDELSWILGEEPNSLFTSCLLEVLRGEHKSVYTEPYIRMTEVVQHVMKRVPEKKPIQRPFVNLQLYDDFILSCVPEHLGERIAQSEIVEGGTDKSTISEVVTTFRESDTAKNLVLFVHGFSGEASDTFGNIPEYLINDPSMDGWDLLPLGYSQNVQPEKGKNVWASVEDISRISDYLQSAIAHRFTQYHRIAIIGHSLGGLAVQQAILQLNEANRNRVSHVILFATPSNGITEKALQGLCNCNISELNEKGSFIQSLRKNWDSQFAENIPFKLKVVSATDDEFVQINSVFDNFPEETRVTIDGNHFSLVQPKSEKSDSFNLIVKTLSNSEFHLIYTNQENINNALGEYEAVVQKLLPQKESLKIKGLRNLIFALEGLDRREEVIDLLQNHPLANDNSDLLGIMGGRYKRMFLNSLSHEDGSRAIDYYSKGLEIAEEKGDHEQIYYLAINLAFLHLVAEEDKQEMRDYAMQALEAAKADPFDSLWKQATLAEANLYLGKFEEAKELYGSAAKMAGIREKISIHTNAYGAYTTLMNTENEDDAFIKFLKMNFLS